MENPKFAAFPYEPYSIQIDFMNALYRFLDKGGVSMLESPTGTGKTLSIICSALQWVRDSRQQKKSPEGEEFVKQEENGQACSEDEPDWMKDFVINIDTHVQEIKIDKSKSLLGSGKHENKKKREGCREFVLGGIEKEDLRGKKEKINLVKKIEEGEMVDEFLLEDYESEEEGFVGSKKSKRKPGGLSIISSSSDEEDEEYEPHAAEEERVKVYFCSRTHSQLSQFIEELRKTNFGNEIQVVCLGSRKNFCINEDVLKLGNLTRINERCLELQKNKRDKVSITKKLGSAGKKARAKCSSGCPMLKKHKLLIQFRNEIFQQGALDIEDLVQLGKDKRTCPYYGSRTAVPLADLVVLPYHSLLSKSSRESLGLNLKNSIIIIDEAHNLADSLIGMYDAKLTLPQLENLHYHIGHYFERFRNRLGAGNRRYIQTLMVITRSLLRVLLNDEDEDEKTAGAKPLIDFSMAINDFLFSLNIDNINLFKLLEYIKESNIIHKVSGYGDKVGSLLNNSTATDVVRTWEEGSTLSAFRSVVDMLGSLTNEDGDGRIIISRTRETVSQQKGGYLKYVMLTGEKIFSEIVDQAHAVILAGGTLQPIEETRERLFPWLPSNQLNFFSCSHIVSPQSILPVAVSRGPSSRGFDFSYSSRSSPTLIEELGLLICNLVTVIPEGIVVFFSSFDYETQVYSAWKNSGILERIMKKKRVFREPRKATDIQVILNEYKETINGQRGNSALQNGAILLAVVGGKISEGINFSDGMGRCIVMVGLPYPSPSNIELLERIKHIEGLGDSNANGTSITSVSDEYINGDGQTGFSVLRRCKGRGKEYYENLCMKAVNQSIGRAIRHINDYAAILLVDARYVKDSSKRSFSHPSDKLPQWIKERLVNTNSYGEVHRLLHQFFKLNKNRGSQS